MELTANWKDENFGKPITEFMEEWKQFAKDMPKFKKAELTEQQISELKEITGVEELSEWAIRNNLFLYQVNPELSFDVLTTVKVEFAFGQYVKDES